MPQRLLLALVLCGCAASRNDDRRWIQDPEPYDGPDQAEVREGETAPPRAGRSGYESVPQFGGGSSTPRQLKTDDRIKETVYRFDAIQRGLAPYFEWKARMVAEHGLALGADYTTLYTRASEDLGGKNEAGSGNFRLFGSWTPGGTETENPGSLVFKVESREAYGSVPVSGLGFETGYVGLLGPPFNDNGWMATNLYWMQKFNDGKTTLLAGVVDATDYVDVYGLINPWTHFSNLAFATGSGTIPAPNQGLGAAAGTFGENLYVVGGVADTNGDPTDLGDSVDTFLSDNEYFTHLEVGWTSSHEERYLNNTHVTVWHADPRENAGVAGGSGVNFSWAQFYADRWLPFLRGGYADDGGALLESSVSTGCGYYMRERSDLLAFGLNWGAPSTDFGSGLPDQYTAEIFYRVQLSRNFALTPDIQYVIDPALNPGVSSMWFFGLRARLSL